MELKGGVPQWLTKIIEWGASLLGIGGDNNSTNTSYGQGSTGNNNNMFHWQPQIIINGQRVDPNSPITLYGSDSVMIQYQDGRVVKVYGVDSLKLGN